DRADVREERGTVVLEARLLLRDALLEQTARVALAQLVGGAEQRAGAAPRGDEGDGEKDEKGRAEKRRQHLPSEPFPGRRRRRPRPFSSVARLSGGIP